MHNRSRSATLQDGFNVQLHRERQMNLMTAIEQFSGGSSPFLSFGANPGPDSQTHTIAQGESLSTIAAQYGTTVDALMAANPQIKNADMIYAGDEITIPASANEDANPGQVTAAVQPTAAKAGNAANENLVTGEAGKKLIRDSEGFSSTPYNDPAGNATIGYGRLLHLGPVTAADRAKWGSISEAEGRALLDQDVGEVEAQVKSLVKVPITQGQLDALVSFGFNLGTGQDGLGGSTLLRKLNAGDYAGAQNEFGRWVKATDQNGNLITLPGLVTRRANEAQLFGNKGPAATGGGTPPPAPNPGALTSDGSLKQGATGETVKTLQNYLVKLGYMSQADVNTGFGTFGAKTDAALKSFQASVGLTADGVVGPNTKGALESIINGVGVNRNANTNVVNNIQNKLVGAKLLSAADVQAEKGVFGPKTEAAVKAFQAQKSIQQTGVVGAQTFAALQASGSGALPANGGYVYPLPAQFRQVNAADKPGEGEGEFGTARSGGRLHLGIDINAPTGTPVYAAKGGTATVLNQPGGAGLYVNVEHTDGTSSQYFHLNTANARVGDSFNVRQGDQIGTVGRSGNTPSGGDTHLHFQVRNSAGTLIDPAPFFPAFRR
jgi:GH24 family phage-related lysozyme (muramidase)/peptidoglycan hydrolase-like protein with peptidoglycan-binding domain